MAVNASIEYDYPPLPSYTLTPRPPLLAPIPDNILALILPIVAYWGLSMVYHVILQQVIQTLAGMVVGYFDDVEYIGREEYDVAMWARRLRLAQKAIPRLLAVFGVDAFGLSRSLSQNGHAILAGVLAGGQYPGVTQSFVMDSGIEAVVPAFTNWELSMASLIYWYFIPAVQFTVGVFIVDTWQYFLHRAMHLNRWLYGMYFDYEALVTRGSPTNSLQSLSTLAIIGFMSHTPSAPSIITRWKASFLILLVLALGFW